MDFMDVSCESGREMTLRERVDIFEEMQEFLAHDIGLSVLVSNGAPIRLYDMWKKRPVDIPVAGCTEIRKVKGKLIPNPFRWTYTNGGN